MEPNRAPMPNHSEIDVSNSLTASDRIADDLAWRSDDPHLSGNFAPIGPEIEVDDLPVIAGRIPDDLSGAYMRNGPNPLFQPISYTYPLDGDGMIHAVYFDNGRARYKNRFVRTRGLAAERRAGHAIYGGVLSPREVDPALTQPDGEPGPFKNGAFINILDHGGHLLALGEASPAYEMTMELETLGEWTAGGEKPISIGAHNRRHPVTGALFALNYSPDSCVVEFHQIDGFGRLVRTFPLTLAAPSMIHDFILTEHHIVLVVGPAVFDMEAAFEGKPFLQWRPDLGTRIAVVPLDGNAPFWLDASPFFVFHFANGFERSGEIVIDYVRHDSLRIGYGGASHEPPTLHRLVLDIAGRRISETRIADFVVEFPRINDRLGSLETRFIYVPTLTSSLTIPNRPSATFNTILKVTPETGDISRHDLGNRIAGEPVFIPRPAGKAEDDGYLAVFSYDPIEKTSDLVLLDAANIGDSPVAVIRLPQRIPQGLHGNWVSRR
jgi:carotenoid cleavage dioxygenase